MGELHRVQKLLSNWGRCSRRKAEELIAEGRVMVNGRAIHLGDKASGQDTITVDGARVMPERRITILFHKPLGCVTAVADKRQKTVLDYVRIPERVFPVGRLDSNTSGLLLLTNDGDFANHMMHPRYEVEKAYVAQLDKPLQARDAARLKQDVRLADGAVRIDRMRQLRPQVIEVALHEGRKHVVRRLFGALGYRVLALKRTRMGRFALGSLKEGEWRYIDTRSR